MQHTLSEQEAQAIRLVHHDFMGLTRKETARQMDISEQRLSSILQSARIKAPQLFPILTPNQYGVYSAFVDDGLNREEIAEFFGWSMGKVDNIIAQLRKKGILLTVPKTVRYKPYMDERIKRKF